MEFDFSELTRVSSLLDVKDAGDGIRRVRVDSIQPDPNQPRKTFVEESLAELAQSIRSIGIIQPPVVRTHHDGYILISGERRWRAASQLGFEVIDVIVRDDLSARAQLVENIQREALSAWEIYRVIAGELEAGTKQVDLAAAFGKSKAWVAAYAAVAKMPDAFVQMLRESRVTGITALQSFYRLHELRPDCARELANSPEPITAVMVERVSETGPRCQSPRSAGTSLTAPDRGFDHAGDIAPESSSTFASRESDGKDLQPGDVVPRFEALPPLPVRIRVQCDGASWLVDYTRQRNEADYAVSVRLVDEDGNVRFGRIEALKLQAIYTVDG